MNWIEVTALIASGLMVGFINTLAGGGTIISMSLFMFLGLPIDIANGTNRIAVTLQNIVSSFNFNKHNYLDLKKGVILGIPTIIGSVLGALVAVDVNIKFFEISVAIIMLIMLFFILLKPQTWLKGNPEKQKKKTTFLQMLIFLAIGFYGGFIHVGVGYFILAAAVLGSGYDLVKANALKVFIVLLYTPFSLVIFILNNQVNYTYGLIHAIGNIIGAFIASQFAVKKGVGFVKWVMVVVILLTSAHMLGILNVKELYHQIF